MTVISFWLVLLASLQCSSPSIDEVGFQLSAELSHRLTAAPNSLKNSDLAIEIKHEYIELGRYHCQVYSVFEGSLILRELVSTEDAYAYHYRERKLEDSELSAAISFVVEGGILSARSIGGPDIMVENILTFIKVGDLKVRKSWAGLFPHDVDGDAYFGLLQHLEQLASQQWDSMESSMLSATSQTVRNIKSGKPLYSRES